MQRTASCLWLAAASLSLSVSAFAQFDPAAPLARMGSTALAELAKPFFDARLDLAGRPSAAVLARLGAARSSAVLAARDRAAALLESSVPGLRIDPDPLFGTPRWVASTAALLTAPIAGDFLPQEVVRGFVEARPDLFLLAPGALARARVTRNFQTRHNGATHLTFQQQVDGLDVFGCELRANVTRRGELINVSSTLLALEESTLATAPVIGAADALALAAADVEVAIARPFAPATDANGPNQRQTWMAPRELRPDEPITSELVLFPRSCSEIHPAWSVVIPLAGEGHTYDILVDALDGTILWRNDRLLHFSSTQPITLRVYTDDSPAPGNPGPSAPNGAQAPFVARTLVTLNPSDVAPMSPNHWIDDNVNETQGNNVDAHLDLNNDNVPDLPRPTGSPARTFDFAQDNTLEPTTYRDASVTNLFYLANYYHDRIWNLGFDEPAGNFQIDNFGRGGVGNDRVQADCQDGGGTNNANFGTSGNDGSSARVQMYVFTAPTPDRDGSLDADVVFHEMTHGTSIRLHHGLSGTQSQGMGEGWSDFVARCFNSSPAEDPNAVYTTGAYVTYLLGAGFVDNYYFGIRRFPYSTDVNKNPETFADIDPGQISFPPAIPRSPVIGNTANEVHNIGEVWCNMLLETRANLIAAHGFAGNDLILRLVLDGMKLSVANPNFLQARDAILQADVVDNGGANLALLWQGFAKRGCGASASSPASSTSNGVVEAFDLPNTTIFAYPNGLPSQLLPGQSASFAVIVAGLGTGTPIAGSGLLFTSVNNGPFSSSAMVQGSANHYIATIPPANCLDLVRYYVSTSTSGGTGSDPSNAPASSRSVQCYSALATVFSDNFQTDLGWTATNQGATSGDWQRGVPVNDPTWAYAPISDSDGSGQCYLTQNAPGNTDVDNGSVTLISPVFDFSGGGLIGYDYFLDLTIADGIDRLLVEMSSNGGTSWTTVLAHTTSGGQAWRHNDIPSSTLTGLGIALTANMKIRFTANDGGTQSIVEAGLDAFKVSTYVCNGAGTPFCFGDGSGAACPCANNGAIGHGCANSTGNSGLLGASGVASVSADSLVLVGSGFPSTASALFFQGTVQDGGGLGVALADGLRCVNGSLVRLGIHPSVGGASSYPQGGDLSVSVRGSIPPAGGTYYYQAWYRDPVSFCNPETYNLSNGLSVVWAP